jgi:hypothetical protein
MIGSSRMGESRLYVTMEVSGRIPPLLIAHRHTQVLEPLLSGSEMGSPPLSSHSSAINCNSYPLPQRGGTVADDSQVLGQHDS